MKKIVIAGLAASASLVAMTATAMAQANEQFIPILSYRTGAYAVNGVPFANGQTDAYALVNARDGGINGVKLIYEECEFGYATDKGVECYERLKGKGPTGAAFFNPLSTGVTFALTEKTLTDKIPIISMGYGRADSKNGAVFNWNFPLLGTYWSGADIALQHIAKELGGEANMKGKKISLVFHDSPFGKEPIPHLEQMAKKIGFEFKPIPVTHPGVEQKSQWLAIRQDKPDYVLLWGWGVMNGVSVQEAAGVNFPRDKMIGVWWSGAEPDVTPAGEQAIGYKALMLQHGAGEFAVHADIKKHLGDKRLGKDDFAQVLYNRGLVNGMLGIEAIRTAQKKFGNKPLTGEQVRWGLENLDISADRAKELGLEGMIRGIKTSCADHEGARDGRVQQWDGKAWKVISDFYTARAAETDVLVKAVSEKYAADKKIEPKCAS
jgi:branched-chain amino acid transport system substrate-binding protein